MRNNRQWQLLQAMIGEYVEVSRRTGEELHGQLVYVGKSYLVLYLKDESAESVEQQLRIPRGNIVGVCRQPKQASLEQTMTEEV